MNDRPLITQVCSICTISVLQGATPVINVTLLKEVPELISMGVNFLRAGCPKVQFLISEKVDEPGTIAQKIEAGINDLDEEDEKIRVGSSLDVDERTSDDIIVTAEVIKSY